MKMKCADCGFVEREFDDAGEDGYVCTTCGWLQDSEASGAAELCRCATWHSQAAYDEMAARARAGGIEVPATPPYFSN